MAKRSTSRVGGGSKGTGAAEARTVLVNSRVTPRFAGVCTFCRFPRLADLPREGEGPGAGPGADWCVFGVPFDGGVTYRPGARFGPRAVRDASQYVKPYHLEHGVNVAEVLRCCDAGDAVVRPYSIKETLESVKAWVVETARGAGSARPAKMLAIGGDHSIAYACIEAARELHSPGKPLALIHLDSHLDTVESVWGERWGHASPFRRLIDDGIVDAEAMLSIGVKGPLNTAADLEYAREQGVTLVTHAEYQRKGPEVVRKFISRLRGRPVYVTFDIDVVDPAFAPGTGTPSVGGFTSAEALAILRLLKGMNLVGADVVEVLPDRDVSQITAMLAAHVAFEILALDAVGR